MTRSIKSSISLIVLASFFATAFAAPAQAAQAKTKASVKSTWKQESGEYRHVIKIKNSTPNKCKKNRQVLLAWGSAYSKAGAVAAGFTNKKGKFVFSDSSGLWTGFGYVLEVLLWETPDCKEKIITKTVTPLPLEIATPIYPRRAQTRGIEGYCNVKFTILTTGEVADAVAGKCEPAGVFESASVKAMLKFLFPPLQTEISKAKYRFTYELAN